jgi:hypothetical protein
LLTALAIVDALIFTVDGVVDKLFGTEGEGTPGDGIDGVVFGAEGVYLVVLGVILGDAGL